jgi:hypothetical protein
LVDAGRVEDYEIAGALNAVIEQIESVEAEVKGGEADADAE